MKLPKSKIELVAGDEAGFSLNNVKLDVEGKRMLAINGHALAIIPIEVEEGDHSALIPVEVLKALRTFANRTKQKDLRISVNGMIKAEFKGEKQEHALGEGTFPNADLVVRLVRQPEGPATIIFNAQTLLNLVKALSDPTAPNSDVISIWVKDGQSSIILKSSSNPDAIGMLMPCRS
jgi:DNA polymerase III sliding clamp (beta) subunit (PCNA family)